jgi:hypothetical protein
MTNYYNKKNNPLVFIKQKINPCGDKPWNKNYFKYKYPFKNEK